MVDTGVNRQSSECTALHDSPADSVHHAFLRAVQTPFDVARRFDRLWELYPVYLDRLAAILNTEHQVTYSRRYWEILTGAWLIKHLMVLLDKYELLLGPCASCVQQLADLPYPPTTLMNWEVVNSTQFDANQAWNEYMLQYMGARIAEFRASAIGRCTVRPQPSQSLALWQRRVRRCSERYSTFRKAGGAVKSALFNLRQGIRERRLAAVLSPVAGGTAFSVNYRYLLLGKARELFDQQLAAYAQRVFLLPELPLAGGARPDQRLRQAAFAALPARNELEYGIRTALIDHFPSIYLESYARAIRSLHRQYPRVPFARVVVFGNLYDSVATNFFTAEQVEHHHAWLVAMQHGGGYGILAENNKERWEIALCDEYLTWGWTTGAKTVPMPAFRCTNLIPRDATAQARCSGVLLVTGACFPYMNEIYRAPQLCAPKEYRQNMATFMREYLAGNPGILHWRPYHALSPEHRGVVTGVQQALTADEWQRIVLHPKEPFYPLLEQMALFVCDHCQTTLLEALAANIPTVLFWDPTWMAPIPAVVEHFDHLARVGILYASPRLAAEFIASIAADIADWWYSAEVQQVRNAFVASFARQEAGVLTRYVEYLGES